MAQISRLPKVVLNRMSVYIAFNGDEISNGNKFAAEADIVYFVYFSTDHYSPQAST
jgi:hypothetical protein